MSVNGDYMKRVEWDKCFSGEYKSYSGTCYAMSREGDYIKGVDYKKCM